MRARKSALGTVRVRARKERVRARKSALGTVFLMMAHSFLCEQGNASSLLKVRSLYEERGRVRGQASRLVTRGAEAKAGVSVFRLPQF